MHRLPGFPRPAATAATAALIALAVAPAVRAQTFITTNTTLDATNPVSDGAVIGYASLDDRDNGANPASPTVDLVAGGSVSGGAVSVYNSSVFNWLGGTLPGILAADSSTVNVNSGSATQSIVATEDSILNLSSGIVTDGVSIAGGTGFVSGGTLQQLTSSSGGRFDLTGGTILGPVSVNNIGSLGSISGGSIGGNVSAGSGGVLTLLGGTITGRAGSGPFSVLNVYGGTVGGGFRVQGNSATLNLFGPDVQAILTNPNVAGFSQYTLSGTLQNGDSVNGLLLEVQNNGSARFAINPAAVAVPEPATLALLLLAAPALIVRPLQGRPRFS